MPLSPGIRLGPYEIVGQIGAGGMGEVWKARDTRLGRDVAIKVLPTAFTRDPERLRRFQIEARSISALNHPNILTIHDLGEHEGSPYLVMELLGGETLRQKLGRKPMPARRTVEMTEQIAQGLAAAHEKGILHRDLKPENLFITRDGRMKILDFGLAKLQAPPIGSECVTRDDFSGSGHVVGTVGYMSPEQVRGEALDARSDLFSLGTVLWEMLAGDRPFKGESSIEVMRAILKDEPAALEAGLKVPPALTRIVETCLAKEPAARFHSAHDLAFALQTIQESGTLSADWEAAVQHNQGEGRAARSLWPWAAGLTALFAVAAVVYLAPWRNDPARAPSVLALPTTVLGGPEAAFLTDAIPGTLTSCLALVKDLDTKLQPSSLQVEKVRFDPAKIAQAYQVENLILTTVTAQGESLVLDVKLVLAATQKVRWAGQFEGTRGTYNQLARQAAEALVRFLRPGASGSLAAGAPGNSELTLALLKGRYFKNRWDAANRESDFDQGLAAFQRAQSLDPASAIATAELAGMYRRASSKRMPQAEALYLAETWVARALELDPRCGYAWAVRVSIEFRKPRPDPDALIGDAFKALAFSPQEPRTHLILGAMSPTYEALLASALHVMQMDPLEIDGYLYAAWCLLGIGKAADALPIIERALQIDPDYERIRFLRFIALIQLGRPEEAKGAYVPWLSSDLRLLLLNGDPAAARAKALAVVTEWRAKEQAIPYAHWGNAAAFYAPLLARLGLRDDALWVLEKCLGGGNAFALDFLLLDPDLQRLNGDPRFTKVLAGTRDYAARFLKHAEAADARGELPAYLKPSLAELRELLKRPL